MMNTLEHHSRGLYSMSIYCTTEVNIWEHFRALNLLSQWYFCDNPSLWSFFCSLHRIPNIPTQNCWFLNMICPNLYHILALLSWHMHRLHIQMTSNLWTSTSHSGHEFPFSIKMSHIRDGGSSGGGAGRDPSTPTDCPGVLLLDQCLPPDTQCQFILKPSKVVPVQSQLIGKTVSQDCSSHSGGQTRLHGIT